MKPIRTGGKEIAQNENAVLFSLISPLEKEELDQLRAFLNSEYFNTDQRLAELFDRLSSGYHNPDSYIISGKALLKNVLGAESGPEDEGSLKKLMKRLEELILEFFIHQEVRTGDSRLAHRAKVAALKRRRDTERFREASEAFREELNALPDSIGKFADRWWLEHQNYFHQNSLTYKKDGEFFQKAFDQFNKFSHALILRYYLEYVNRKNLFSKTLSLQQIETLYQDNQPADSDSSLFELYNIMIDSLQDPGNVDTYLQLKAAYHKRKNQLSGLDILVTIKVAQNVCNYLFQQGWSPASGELFFWAKEGIRQKAFSFDNVISDREYLNMALSAAAAGAFEYQLKFMNAYREELEPQYRDKAYQLALAYLHFHKKEYQQTVDILQEHFPKNTHEEHSYTLRVKTLLVRTYLLRFLQDWSWEEAYDKEVDALRKFLGRKEFLNEKWRESYENFIEICNSISRYRTGCRNWEAERQREEKAERLRKIESYRQVASRLWLRNLIHQIDKMMAG